MGKLIHSIIMVSFIWHVYYAHGNIVTYCAEEFKEWARELPKKTHQRMSKKANNGLLERILFLENTNRFEGSRLFKKLSKKRGFKVFLKEKIIEGLSSEMQTIKVLKIYVSLYGKDEELFSEMRNKIENRFRDYYMRLEMEELERVYLIKEAVALGLFNTGWNQIDRPFLSLLEEKDRNPQIKALAQHALWVVDNRAHVSGLRQAVYYSLKPLMDLHVEVSLFIDKVIEEFLTKEAESVLLQIIASRDLKDTINLFLNLVKQVEDIPDLSVLSGQVVRIVLHFEPEYSGNRTALETDTGHYLLGGNRRPKSQRERGDEPVLFPLEAEVIESPQSHFSQPAILSPDPENRQENNAISRDKETQKKRWWRFW